MFSVASLKYSRPLDKAEYIQVTFQSVSKHLRILPFSKHIEEDDGPSPVIMRMRGDIRYKHLTFMKQPGNEECCILFLIKTQDWSSKNVDYILGIQKTHPGMFCSISSPSKKCQTIYLVNVLHAKYSLGRVIYQHIVIFFFKKKGISVSNHNSTGAVIKIACVIIQRCTKDCQRLQRKMGGRKGNQQCNPRPIYAEESYYRNSSWKLSCINSIEMDGSCARAGEPLSKSDVHSATHFMALSSPLSISAWTDGHLFLIGTFLPYWNSCSSMEVPLGLLCSLRISSNHTLGLYTAQA